MSASPEYGKRPCRLFHTVIHGCDILADVDRLDGQRRAEYGLRRHHDLGRGAALVRLRKDAHLPLGCVPDAHDVEHKGLDAVRGTREADEPSLTVEHVVEEAVVRAAIELRLVCVRICIEECVRLRLGDAVCRIEELARLLGRDRPLHRFVHSKEEDDDQSSHDKRIAEHEPQAAAPEYVLLVQCGVSNLYPTPRIVLIAAPSPAASSFLRSIFI